MDKSKADKLKEVLNQTLSSEEIEKKLKDEIKQNAQKKISQAQNQENEQNEIKNIENKKEEKKVEQKEEQTSKESIKTQTINKNTRKTQSPLNKKVDIPNVREKKKDANNMNMILYLVILIAVLLLAIVIYLFAFSNESTKEIPKSTIEKNELKKKTSDIKLNKMEIKEEIEKPEVKEVKEEIKKPEEKEIEEVNTKEEKEKKQEPLNKKEKQLEPKVIIKEVIKEKIVIKPVKLDKKSFKQFYNSSKFNTLKCYDFKAGSIFPNKTCKDSLGQFLKDNIDAIRIEIIPVIAQADYVIFKQLEQNIKTLDKDYQDRVKEYMFRGLARQRVLEVTWKIRDILGHDTLLTPTNYYVNSKKDNKGVIIKAYH